MYFFQGLSHSLSIAINFQKARTMHMRGREGVGMDSNRPPNQWPTGDLNIVKNHISITDILLIVVQSYHYANDIQYDNETENFSQHMSIQVKYLKNVSNSVFINLSININGKIIGNVNIIICNVFLFKFYQYKIMPLISISSIF